MSDIPVIEKADELPPLRRGGGRHNPLRDAFVEALKSLDINVIENVGTHKEYNALQQRIRTAASAIGMKVTIRQKPIEGTDSVSLYFQGELLEDDGDEVVEKVTAKKATTKK